MAIPDITIPGTVLPKEPGPVIEIQGSEVDEGFGPGCMFRCPCGERRIVVRKPPHESITFDSDGRPSAPRLARIPRRRVAGQELVSCVHDGRAIRVDPSQFVPGATDG